MFFLLVCPVCTYLDIGHIVLELAWIDLFLESGDQFALTFCRGYRRYQVSDLQFVNLGRCTYRHLWKHEPSYNDCNSAKASEAFQKRLSVFPSSTRSASQKHVQKSCLDSPFRGVTVYHQGCAKAEHDGNHIGRCKSPARCLSS